MANLFSAKLGKLFPALGQLDKVGVTDEMWERIGEKDGEYALAVYQALVAKMNGGAATTPETVTVPDLPAAELIALVQRSFEEAGIPFTYFNEDLAAWDFLLNERGKTFHVFTHNFVRDWETHEARAWQKSIGADGNVAAFIAWVIAKKPMGWFVSIPNDDSCLWRDPVNGHLCAPSFDRDRGGRDLRLYGVQGEWHGDSSVVAFRAI